MHFELVLDADISAAGAEGSQEREEWTNSFKTALAADLGIAAWRILITYVQPGSLKLGIEILDTPTTTSEISAAEAQTLLTTQLHDASDHVVHLPNFDVLGLSTGSDSPGGGGGGGGGAVGWIFFVILLLAGAGGFVYYRKRNGRSGSARRYASHVDVGAGPMSLPALCAPSSTRATPPGLVISPTGGADGATELHSTAQYECRDAGSATASAVNGSSTV